jgi:hypothetical protein
MVLTMAEYIERGALMQFPIRRDHYDRENGNEHFINGIETVLEYAENLPAANVAPVVRCKDCKHYEPEEYEFGCVFAGGLSYVKADDYCSYGERKDYD